MPEKYVTLTQEDFDTVLIALESYTCSITMDSIEETMDLLEEAWEILKTYR